LPCDPAIPLLGDTQRNATQVITKAPAYPCLLQHYSQWPSYGNYQYMDEENVVFIYNGILFSHKKE
jgi:hypothetical protein